ncbi:transposase [Alteromonas sp. V450]|uniref:transposase n=1 Tax=Alteromonas sp. V450 TaxID=1912139 RepID=UPI0008FF5383|nr:transposase [Alteromonas sp. V450]OJF68331.1 transposase [Alteromonas sp. V450]OJF69062.1 transposase [Alteromonas sp. V450]
MSKYHKAFKLKLARLAQEESSGTLGPKFEVRPNLIRYWSQVYRINGAESFTHKQRPYSFEFKIHVLKTMSVHNWSLTYTSAYFDLSSPGILFQWQKLYAHEGITRLKPQKIGRPRVINHSSTPKPSSEMTEKELREELDYLRAENAVLKKLEALAQARKKKTKTKR